MTNSEIAARIALSMLLQAYVKLCKESCKNPERNEAYRQGVIILGEKECGN